MSQREEIGASRPSLRAACASLRTAGRRTTGWPIAARCARIWCVRPVSSLTRSRVVRGSRSRTSKWVTASRARSVRVDITVRFARSRPIGASIVPLLGVRMALHERQVLARDLARLHHALERRVAPPRTWRPAAGPEVSRSSRCTIPARSGPRPRPRSASASVDPVVPRRGMRHEARGLVHHHQVVVLVDDLERRPRRGVGAGGGLARRDGHHARPPRRRWLFARAAPSTVTAPGVDQPLRAPRASAKAPRAARNASSRSAGVVRRPRSALASPLRPPLDHLEQRHDADHDAGVGDVEGRPGDRVDEVDHRALAGPVDRLPSAPPSSRPTGSHSHGMSRLATK